jgi:hypothetical protein
MTCFSCYFPVLLYRQGMHSSFATDLFFLQLLIFWCCFIDKVPMYVLQDNLEFPVFVTYSSGCFLLLLYPSGMHSSFAGKVSIQVIPQMLSLAINFPTQKFLQAQSKVRVLQL